ncbi:cytochrome c oxidase assembly factor Coa1 family protein [Bdellovibrio sp. BCCA]|uniref:cytochrome c oxidase assembly factor Coa1 family protein n=1 Tax=Bdellovibrio sp. BCCA TaxID=3136281 RepID=UPI0030F25187
MKKLIITVALLVVFFAEFHLLVANSDGVDVASKYLRDNSEVRKVVGAVSKTSLIPLASELKDYGREGSATYHIKIIGTNGAAEGIVTSIKTDGMWKVDKAHLLLEDKDIIILKQ